MTLNRHEIETAPVGSRVQVVRRGHRGAIFRRVTSSTWQAITRPTGGTPAHVDGSRDLFVMGVELLEGP